MSFTLPPRPGTLDKTIDVPLTAPQGPPSSLRRAFGPAFTLYDRFSEWRTALALPNPGNVENLQREVKSTHLTNFMFDGARADLAKSLSVNPGFQVTHGFTLASQTQDPTYTFSSLFMSEKTFLHGSIDHEGNLSGRFTQQWLPYLQTKGQMQLASTPDRSVLQLESEYSGADYTLNLKTVNPSPLDLSGVYIGSYLQSITPKLALGIESVYQQAPEGSDLSHSYIFKYSSQTKSSSPSPSFGEPPSPFGDKSSFDASKGNEWIATAQFHPLGLLQASYWQKLSPQVEVAADLQLIANPAKRDAIATVGAKWDLRMATFRAQIDSAGKVSALLEQRFAPSFSFLLSGEVDHFKNTAKVGVGIMIESSSVPEEQMLAMQNQAQGLPHPQF